MSDIGETLIEWEVPYGDLRVPKLLKSMSKKKKEVTIKGLLKGILYIMLLALLYCIISGPQEAFRFLTLFGIAAIPVMIGLGIFLFIYSKVGRKIKKHNKLGTKGVLIGPIKRSWEDFESYEANPESNTFTLYYSKRYQMKNLMMGNPFLVIKASDNFKEIDYALSRYLRKE